MALAVHIQEVPLEGEAFVPDGRFRHHPLTDLFDR